MGFRVFQLRNTCVPRESHNHQKYPKISYFTLRFSVTCERPTRRYASIKPLILLGFCNSGILKFVFEDMELEDGEFTFVKFRLSQKTDNEGGTIIKNNVNIFHFIKLLLKK